MPKNFLLKLSGRWIAGQKRSDAIERAKRLNRLGIHAVINYLGEHYKHLSLVEQAEKEYLHLISGIKKLGLNASVSVKLSELGLDFSKKLCRKELGAILEKAQKKNVFVWLDMEGHSFTEKTIEIYLHFLPFFGNLGITIQSSLKRSARDIKTLLRVREAKIRLVKGAYLEPEKLAFKNKAEIRAKFSELMHLLFSHQNYFAIATHDLRLIEEAKSVAKAFSGKKEGFEFQMLMGIKNRLKKSLAKQGYKVTEYVPYGKNWLPYIKRRLLERRSNILYAIKSIFE